MKDLLPAPVTANPAVGNAAASAVGQSSAETSQTGVISGDVTASAGPQRSFASSLLMSLQSLGNGDATAGGNIMAGNSLPLEPEAAAIGPLAALQNSADGLVSSDRPDQNAAAIVPGMPTGTLNAMVQETERSSPAPSAAGLTGALRHATTMSAEPVDIAVNVQATGGALNAKPTVVSQAVQTPGLSGQLNLLDTMTARIPPGTLESLPHRERGNRASTLKTSGTLPASNVSVVDVQSMLRPDGAINETDLLFTSRMQQSAVAQSAELTAQKLMLDTLPSTTQGGANDLPQSAMVRMPLTPQTSAMNEYLQTAPSQSSIMEAFGKPEWGQGMGRQLLWMVNQNISRAEIRLNPAHLGPLEVRIEMENDQVNVAFTSRHAEVREAVEQAMPRLREMLEEKGLNLSDTDVSQHSFAEQREKAFDDTETWNNGFASGSTAVDDEGSLAENSHRGLFSGDMQGRDDSLVDYYI